MPYRNPTDSEVLKIAAAVKKNLGVPLFLNEDESQMKTGKIIEYGEVWRMGEHLVICGNWNDETLVETIIYYEYVTGYVAKLA